MKSKLMIAGLALSLGALIVTAQDQGTDRPPRQGGGGPGGPGGPGGMRGGPLMAALDANQDGELDATELANATAALKKLDKNNDGKLTAEELRPQRPPGAPGAPGGQGQRRGQNQPQ